MPEAPVDENYFSPSRKDEIRRTGQGSAMQSEAISKGMHQAADGYLRSGVFSPHPRHAFASFGWA
jgi:hypothetical protein